MTELDGLGGQRDHLAPAVSDTDIAIIGMAGRFPGAHDVDELWRHVVAGDDCLTDLDRGAQIAAGMPTSLITSTEYVARSGVLDDMEGFDHRFFGIGARDAAIMDPQHRHFLECAWETLESAAIVPERFDGAIGVFGGCGMGSYLINNLLTNDHLLEQLGWFLLRHTGNDKDFLTNNVAYRFDLHGPAVNVQTACSTSLVAVHLAVQSLLSFECDIALAGGVTIDPTHRDGYRYQEGEILAPDGICRAFDAESAGTVLTSGVAMIAAKRLADAVADGDPILAVIKATAINNDGSRKVGFLAPSVDGHRDVILEALAVADLSARDIQLFEAHGTGTEVGDPIEIAAATEAYRASTADRGFCRIGSTKPNVGHLDTAAGATSLIKVIQALRNQTLPPLANHTSANPLIDFAGSPFHVSDVADPWPATATRRAGISSLGVGGTNAHVIVEEAPRIDAPAVEPSVPEHVLALSALTATALETATQRLADHLEANPDLDLAQVARTLADGRRPMSRRQVVTATDLDMAVDLLRTGDRHRRSTGTPPEQTVRLGFMFGGGGSQYTGMGTGLDTRFETFHRVRSECIDLVRDAGGVDLAPLLAPGGDPAALRPPTASLPAVFVTAIALARQWMDFGAAPDVLIGHSLGEYVAAHLAGVFGLEDAIRLVVARSALMERASGTDAAMLVVPLPADVVLDALPADLSLAVVNTVDECVVAGRRHAIDSFAAMLDERGTPGSLIPLAAAAHSALLDPVLDEFADVTRTVAFKAPDLPYPSNLTGAWITASQATDPQYWVDHLRGTVRFADCLQTALGDGQIVVTELGPGQALSSFARRADPKPLAAIPVLRHPDHDICDTAYTLQAFARQWTWGVDVDLGQFAGQGHRRLRLPTYPFEHERCWIEPGRRFTGTAPSSAASDDVGTDEPARIDDLDAACWTVEWTAAAHPTTGVTTGSWVVIGDADDEFVGMLTEDLTSRGVRAHAIAGVTDLGEIDDLTGIVVVAPAGTGSYSDSVDRWFVEAIAAVRRLGAAAGAARFVAITRDALAATGVAAHPSDAMALGVSLVGAREYPSLTARVIDVSDDVDIAAVVDDVLGDGPEVVALRPGSRTTPETRQAFVPHPADSTPTFRRGATYIVTGALGGVGHVLATHLVEDHGADLIVFASASVPEGDDRQRWLDTHAYDDPTSRRIRRLRSLEAHGTDVTVIVTDLADNAAVRLAVAEAERIGGHIDGAIHAAGNLRDRLIEFAGFDDHDAVLAAKAGGALTLAHELEARGAELLLLVSSTSTALAPPGQASYVGANAVLDALHGKRGTLRTVTINFGLWSGVGIASDIARRNRLELTDFEPIDHPVFSERSRRPDGTEVFVGRVDAETNWIVDEHRTAGGIAVYPGTGHLQLMLSAASLAHAGRSDLSDVVLLTPLVVPDGAPVTVRAEIDTDGRIEISSDGGDGQDWTLHSQGTILARPAAESSDTGPDGDVLRTFADLEPTTIDLLGAQRTNMDFGPRWDSIVDVRRGDGVMAAHLQLPGQDDSASDEAVAWSPHPALLDVATGVGLALAPPSTETVLYVPARYGRVWVAGSVPAEIIVRAVECLSSSADRMCVDLLAVDLTGATVFAIEGLELVRMAGHAALGTVDAPRPVQAPSEGSVVGWADELGVRPAEGIEFVERLLASPHDRMIASTIRLSDLIAGIDPGSYDDQTDGAISGADDASSLESALAFIWAELLGLDDVGPDDDFFDLGGHSLIAIRLMARIHREIGVRLELATIFDAPTVATLGARIREEHPAVDESFGSGVITTAGSGDEPTVRRGGSDRHLIPISTRGSGKPLYVVHGAGGNILFLGGFGRAMSNVRPVYGFQAHGVDAADAPDDSIEAMATRYVSELRSHAPGPYLLGGYSGGGIVALEMTRMLQRAGERVDGVVLFDSPVGRISLGRRVHARHMLDALRRHGPRPVVPLVTSRLQGHPLGRKLFFGGRKSVHQQSHEVNYEEMVDHGFNDLFDHFTEVCNTHRLSTYDIDTVLVKAQLRWPLMSEDYGWGTHIEGRLRMIIAPGDHESMFQGDNVEVLVSALAPVLEAFEHR